MNERNHMRCHPFFHAFSRGEDWGRREPPFARGFGRRGPDFDGGPKGGPFGGPGRRRMFDQGDLRFVVLKLIADKPSHGYEIIKAIEERVGGAYAPSPGVIYPTLTLLEEMGAIAVSQTDGPRKLYAVTPEGEATLRDKEKEVEAIFARMEDARARHGGGPAPQILRAMENFRTALRLRLSRGPLSADEVARLAAILDEAAKGVENA